MSYRTVHKPELTAGEMQAIARGIERQMRADVMGALEAARQEFDALPESERKRVIARMEVNRAAASNRARWDRIISRAYGDKPPAPPSRDLLRRLEELLAMSHEERMRNATTSEIELLYSHLVACNKVENRVNEAIRRKQYEMDAAQREREHGRR
jgi:hypothetical protein